MSAMKTPLIASPPREAVCPGDYFHSRRELYCVEEVVGSRVMVEDCRSGVLIEMGLESLLRLERVAPASDD
jgi:hypothetical protein